MNEFNEKTEFYQKMDKCYLEKPGKKPYTAEKIESIIGEINDAKLTVKKRQDYYILQKYEVLAVAEKKYLIHNGKEDKIDIIAYHIRTGHGGIGKMRAVLSKQYSIPRPAIETFLSIYVTCNNEKGVNRKLVIKPIVSKDFNGRGQIDLVDFQSLPDGKYKWILNYQDHHTKFISLLPLESKRAVEVASNLLTIFLTFDALKILQNDNGREFVNSIINEIKELWPEYIIVHGRTRHLQSQGSIERSNQDVENMLRAWMKDNKTKKWSIGLKFVQFQKNSSHHRIIGRSPYKELFGCDPKIGLSTSNLPLETIHEERKTGHAGQEKAAKKMLQVSNAVIPEFKINDCITISVPKVDRGPLDSVRVIAVIIEEKNEMYKVGTMEHMVLLKDGSILKICSMPLQILF
ncbi:hypothetical protein QTP88_025657 [Uroleucon formosanum]